MISEIMDKGEKGMRKGSVLMLSLLFLALAFLVFVFNGSNLAKVSKDEDVEMATDRELPAADGRAVWDYLKTEGYAKHWQMWPGRQAFYPGQQPHGALVTAYVNKVGYMAFAEKRGMFADGAMVVKENYTADKKLVALSVMYKAKGFNPAAGDWFWAQYLPDGKIVAAGKVDMCIQCHGIKKDNDYIMTAPMK
jgi:Cytochrome P460